MNLCSLISNIHWLPVIAMTIFSFVLGALWHQPFLFGNTWKRENNMDNPKTALNIPFIFGGTALMHFITLAGLSAVASGQGSNYGLLSGLLISLVWILPAMCATYLFAGRSIKLLLIDAGMYVLLFSLAGLIMGIW